MNLSLQLTNNNKVIHHQIQHCIRRNEISETEYSKHKYYVVQNRDNGNKVYSSWFEDTLKKNPSIEQIWRLQKYYNWNM